jgi:hypothetical protein
MMLKQKIYPGTTTKAAGRFFGILVTDEITFFVQLLRLRNDDFLFY